MTTILTMPTVRLLTLLPQASGVLRERIETVLRGRGVFCPVVIER